MNTMQEILNAVAKGELTAAEAQTLIANLGKRPKGVNFSATPKGCVAISGIRSRGIFLYPNEILKIIENSDKAIAFIEANRDKLSFNKGDKDAPADEQQAAA